jgi:hypothetical protein
MKFAFKIKEVSIYKCVVEAENEEQAKHIANRVSVCTLKRDDIIDELIDFEKIEGDDWKPKSMFEIVNKLNFED